MSHPKTVIEPAAGLTVIVGPNNCGKSAIVSALQTLCGDHDGDFMVRHGAKSCQVTVETDDGHELTWRRKGKAVSYVLDGVDVHRVGRGNLPDGLHEMLRLPKVRHPNGDKEFDVHFGDQKSPIFLIDKEADTAAFFSTASDAEKLIEMQKRHKDKVREAKREQGKLVAELKELDGLLATLEPLDQINLFLNFVEAREEELEVEEEAIAELGLLIGQIEKQGEMVAVRRDWAGAFGGMKAPPEWMDLGPLEKLIGQLRDTTRWAEQMEERAGALGGISDPPVLSDDRALAGLCDRIEAVAAAVLKMVARREALAGLSEPTAPADVQAMADFVRRMDLAMKLQERYAVQQGALATLTDAPADEDTTPLADLVSRIAQAERIVTQNRQAMVAHDREIEALSGDIATWLGEHPICPTCGAATSREAILQGAHAHGAGDGKGGAHHE